MKMDELTLHQAGIEDSTYFYELKKLVLYHYVDAIWGWDEKVQEQFHEENFHPEQTHLIEWKHQIVGTIEITEDLEKIFISSLYIHPNFQNNGIGTCLINYICERATAKNKKVALEVLQLNKAAKKLYEKLGFYVISNQDPIKFYMQKNYIL